MSFGVFEPVFDAWNKRTEFFKGFLSRDMEEKKLSPEIVLDIEAIKQYVDMEEATKILLYSMKNQMCLISKNGFLMYDHEFMFLGNIVDKLLENKLFTQQAWFKKCHYYLNVEFPVQVKKCLSKYAEEAIMTNGYLREKEVSVIYNANRNIIERIREFGFEHLDV